MEQLSRPFLVLQYDNRVLSKCDLSLQKRNQEYCKLHGYTYIFSNTHYDMPPYWIKVKIVQEHLQTNKYKGILWLDTDAVIHKTTISLEHLALPGYSMYYCSDPQINGWDNKFNAGVWLIMNDELGNQLINEWMAMYNKESWSFSSTKWITTGPWAGIDYEQGAFNKRIIPKYQQNIHQYPWEIFQCHTIKNQNAFSFHFAMHLKRLYLEDYVKKMPELYVHERHN